MPITCSIRLCLQICCFQDFHNAAVNYFSFHSVKYALHQRYFKWNDLLRCVFHVMYKFLYDELLLRNSTGSAWASYKDGVIYNQYETKWNCTHNFLSIIVRHINSVDETWERMERYMTPPSHIHFMHLGQGTYKI